ncbi:MAG: hypothetical protein LBJ95_04035 [Oscillospiraceae bacterium]|jgi:acyl-ACP thioesterase|nr:hypothetical protein [Oscillospiraceae bacterium]
MIKQNYKKNVVVCTHECDFKNRMKISSLLNQTQQIGIEHCDSLGIRKQLSKTNTAFFIAKVLIEFYQEIYSDEELLILTEPYPPTKAIYRRYTDFYRISNNTCLASLNASWVLVDVKNKKILRTPPEQLNLNFTNDPKDRNTGQQIKLRRTDKDIFAGEEKALYSRCDANGHLNNAEYASIICDYLPSDMLSQKLPKHMLIAYHHELLFGECMKIFISELAKNEYYFYGAKDEKKYFEANILF